MRLNPNKTWSKGQCEGVAIDYGKSTTKNEFKSSDVDNSEHCDGGPHQVKQINDENEFKDTNFEDLVMSEGPQ